MRRRGEDSDLIGRRSVHKNQERKGGGGCESGQEEKKSEKETHRDSGDGQGRPLPREGAVTIA